jgi:hypothetical protein
MILLASSSISGSLEEYTLRELRRVFRERRSMALPDPSPTGRLKTADDALVVGTADASPAVRELLATGFLQPAAKPQGYSMRYGPHPLDSSRWLLAITGVDPAGVLYGLRDLEHYHLPANPRGPGPLAIEPFERREHPLIEYRGHWIWGCNMPDKRAWIDNMSRWKLNELIHWDNFPPALAREYVAYAHERGVRVIWGFGWGWVPAWNFQLPPGFDRGTGEGVEMCASSESNRQFFKREILRKVREDYAPTGCDGLYFQSFTECPKCQCPRCADQTMGELMLQFVNPIVDAVKRDFPGLWISCGIHHDFGDFSYLRELDPRCNIYWENCEAGTSVRGPDEDFGYIYKSIPYGHGYSATCPADPPYTEASLRDWMNANASQYRVEGGLGRHYQYMRFLQNWGRRFLGKPSSRKHASVVADHSVFCRRTPFPHAALAEAQWNPERDTESTVNSLLAFLGLKETVERTPDPPGAMRDPGGKPPWLCAPESGSESAGREGHAE